MPKPVVRVALVGPAGAGKSTHAKKLQQQFGGDVLSFAGPLKKLCRDMFGDQMDDPVFSRTALQVVGTTFRKLDPEVWVRQLLKKIPNTRSVFVDDCRFLNEYAALERYGFTFIRLQSSPTELQRRRPSLTAAQANHESELEQALFHVQHTVVTDPALATVLHGMGESDEYEMVPESEEESVDRVHQLILDILASEMNSTAA